MWGEVRKSFIVIDALKEAQVETGPNRVLRKRRSTGTNPHVNLPSEGTWKPFILPKKSYRLKGDKEAQERGKPGRIGLPP